MFYGWSDYDVVHVTAKAVRPRPAFLKVGSAEGCQELRENEMRNGVRRLLAIVN